MTAPKLPRALVPQPTPAGAAGPEVERAPTASVPFPRATPEARAVAAFAEGLWLAARERKASPRQLAAMVVAPVLLAAAAALVLRGALDGERALAASLGAGALGVLAPLAAGGNARAPGALAALLATPVDARLVWLGRAAAEGGLAALLLAPAVLVAALLLGLPAPAQPALAALALVLALPAAAAMGLLAGCVFVLILGPLADGRLGDAVLAATSLLLPLAAAPQAAKPLAPM
ncbi:MAG TPA: hypothetical protein VGR28_06445, partial [Candidatus Thermoplasmatota archaeon]|nr:hypothetical protein [Candidatus Thermoplasmatota archaeon]